MGGLAILLGANRVASQVHFFCSQAKQLWSTPICTAVQQQSAKLTQHTCVHADVATACSRSQVVGVVGVVSLVLRAGKSSRGRRVKQDSPDGGEPSFRRACFTHRTKCTAQCSLDVICPTRHVAKRRYQAVGFPCNRMLKLSSSRGIRIDIPVMSVSWSFEDHSVICLLYTSPSPRD